MVDSDGPRLGIDVGEARVGVARSDCGTRLAIPVATLARETDGADLDALAGLVRDLGIASVYVGLPRSLDGTEGEAARRARDYATQLARRIGSVRIRLVDERFTTVLSHRQLHDSGRSARTHRAVVDQQAAVLILQGALDHESATGQDAGETVGPSGRKPRTKGSR